MREKERNGGKQRENKIEKLKERARKGMKNNSCNENREAERRDEQKIEKGKRGEQEQVKRWKERGSLYGAECRQREE